MDDLFDFAQDSNDHDTNEPSDTLDADHCVIMNVTAQECSAISRGKDQQETSEQHENTFHANSKAKSTKIFCPAKLFCNSETNRFARVFPLVDSGNTSGDCLISAHVWETIHGGQRKAPRLDKTRKRLYGAGGRSITVLGRTPKRVKFVFENGQSKFIYHTKPLVVPELSVGVLLGYKDLVNSKAYLIPYKDVLRVPMDQSKPENGQFIDLPLISREYQIKESLATHFLWFDF